MPYIKDVNGIRDKLADGKTQPNDAGELNFTISALIDDYLTDDRLSYAKINEVIGVLECAKLELYRRVAAPYEDIKIRENGDVYTVV